MSLMSTMIARRALAEHRKGNFEEALKYYREALQKGMNEPGMLINMSTLLVRTSHFDEALEIIKKAEKAGRLDERAKRDIHLQYAVILWKKGHIDHAIEILENDFATTKTGTLYSALGCLKIEQGNPEEALRFCLEALDYDDNDPIFLDNVGQAYYRLYQDKEKAKPYFERALALKPEAIDTNYFLALYDLDSGDKEKAKERLEIARNGKASPLNYATPQRIEEMIQRLEA